ncbi:MazG nucleotide pyrophosphohydrolase domain-containing protein [Mycoplasmopsis edwardii]|uniref:Nucleotide pyrophosphohydrolase n=1 Tax=Mycoplasmopsis edwardii TaxID=53558 RepID=A0ACD4PH51_9BACT|nr:MazG nucleotide pyrophosphohydrolase domain-containing protein [Mycoplasmopsis edwardii]WBP83984.1 nucleotide pyrophosphohydrolase [Mycoplasmopsis edwardii]
MKKDITIKQMQEYLNQRYSTPDRRNNLRLAMKLVEEVGEVAEAVNIAQGWKKPKDGISFEEELADVIHYTIALASINNIDLTEVIFRKDKEASKRYNHPINLEEFIDNK